MAPINPLEILEAFTPYLTDSGGIKKQKDDSQYLHLYSIMRDCSTKLVSRCIYCRILTSTSSEVLDLFLETGVWNLINVWVKASKDDGNVAFLVDLLKLLYDLPMTISRLRENECPKVVKKLCKHDNEEIALKANQIIKKWTKIIHAYSEKATPSDQNGGSTLNSNVKDKKRKAESATAVAPPNESSKKAKSSSSTKVESLNNVDKADTNSNQSTESVNLLSDVDPYEAFSRDDMNKFMVEPPKSQEPKRPVTVKVKQGKFRLDLSSAPSPQPSGKAKKKAEMKDTKGSDVKKLPTNKFPTSGNGTIKIPALKISLNSPTPHVVKDSVSFMDALSVMPVVNVKKRRKINKECESASTNKLSNSQEVKVELSGESNSDASDSSVLPTFGSTNHDVNNSNNNFGGSSGKLMPKVKSDLDHRQERSNDSLEVLKSPPRFSFYKDILEDAKSEEESNNAEIIQSNDSQNKVDNIDDDSPTENDSETAFENSVSSEKALSDDNTEDMSLPDLHVVNNADTFKPKSILNYVKKGSKKSVRWPDDDSNLEQVKFFELDETERINVTRTSSEMKRFDMKHEAQMFMDAKKRCITYSVWKLFPILLSHDNLPVEKGYNSKERDIQAELMKTTLECFYIQNQIPDSPREPDIEFFTDSNEHTTKIIPLEDENSADKTQDYSSINITSPILTDQTQPSYDYSTTISNNVSYNPDMKYSSPSDTYHNIGNNYQPPNPTPQYQQGPSSIPNSNYMSPTPVNFDGGNTNYSYNNNYNPNVNAPLPSNQPPMYSNPNPNMYPDYQNNSNYGPPMNNVAPSPGSPPNMFNANQAPNFFSQGQQQPPQLTPNDNSYNSYWPESNNMPPVNNYQPPGPGGQFHHPPPHPGPGQGPRFRRGGRGGRGKGGSDVCRFFSRFGKCKFEQRCNFSHVLDNSKPPRF